MTDTEAELIYTEDAPLALGEWDGKGKGKLVIATGYGFGFRLGQVGYVVGDLVQDALDSHLLVPYDAASVPEGATPGVPATQEPGTLRRPDYSPELGIKPALGTSKADTNSFVTEPDNKKVWEPAGPTSISDDASQKRPTARRRVSDENRVDPNLVTENADNERTARRDQAAARPHAVAQDSRENAAQAQKAGEQLERAEADVREGMQANEQPKADDPTKARNRRS